MRDKLVEKLIRAEKKRQAESFELIPSENYVSEDVLKANGSIFTNKYSEGYPGRRYYGGQEFTDQLETLAIERAKKLFRCDHANVQPLSGSPMNQAVYLGLMKPGDTIMGMDLSHGGHLTHGHPVSHMGKLFNWVRYKTHPEDKGRINYEELLALAKEHKPKIILCGYTSYPRDLDYSMFKRVADEVGAFTMADIAHIGGLVAAGVMRNPFDYGFDIVTTTTHKTLRGPRGGLVLSKGKVGNPLKEVPITKENLPTVLDRSVFPGLQGGPHMHTIAGIAVTLDEASKPKFKKYGRQVLLNSKKLAARLMKLGVKLVTDGTDNHMMVIDCVKSFNMLGGEAEKLLDEVGITTNKSMIPDDPNPPYRPSGLRLGTPAMTTRGLKEKECERIAELIVTVLKNKDTKKIKDSVHKEIKALARKFPIPKKFI
ncbi:MAG TPA: serine hydroxymethyltransferase [Candidatus Paceibacterota bacterium]|jgi:glycine hydroxymethyltransferase|nr:serine hydroxymethyltransferase [Candidatus Paceibacterota bacterium]